MTLEFVHIIIVFLQIVAMPMNMNTWLVITNVVTLAALVSVVMQKQVDLNSSSSTYHHHPSLRSNGIPVHASSNISAKAMGESLSWKWKLITSGECKFQNLKVILHRSGELQVLGELYAPAPGWLVGGYRWWLAFHYSAGSSIVGCSPKPEYDNVNLDCDSNRIFFDQTLPNQYQPMQHTWPASSNIVKYFVSNGFDQVSAVEMFNYGC